jgi:hypothetical protein
MRPSSSSLASALEGQHSISSHHIAPPTELPVNPAPPAPTPTPIPTLSVAPISHAPPETEKETTVETNNSPPVIQTSYTNVVMPPHPVAVPHQAPMHSSPVVPTPPQLANPILPTIPTPSQTLSMTARQRLPPIRIPGRLQRRTFPVILPTSAAVPIPTQIPAASTQPVQSIRLSSFSPAPVPPPASASTPPMVAPAASRRTKKTAIPEDLAQADMEWLNATQRKKKTEVLSKPPAATRTTSTPPARQEGKATPVPEELELSDFLWLERKRKKDAEAAQKRAVGEKVEVNVHTPPAIAGPLQTVGQPGNAGSATTPAFSSQGSNPKPAKNESNGQTSQPIVSDSITKGQSSGIVPDSTSEAVTPGSRKQTPQARQVTPMNIDQPPSKTDVRMPPSSQTDEQRPDTSIIPPAHPAQAQSEIRRDVETQSDHVAVASSSLSTEDVTAANPAKAIRAGLDSSQTSHQIIDLSGGGAVADQETSPVSLPAVLEFSAGTNVLHLKAAGGSGEQLINDEQVCYLPFCRTPS